MELGILGKIFKFLVKKVRLQAENGGVFWDIDFWAKNRGQKSQKFGKVRAF